MSSERAIVRTRNISCLKDGKTIDMPIKGHVSFRGKNGIKGEVVMRNGKILGWAWGAGFVDGDGAESQPDPAGCAGRNAGGAYFLLDSSWSLFRPEKCRWQTASD